MKKALLIFLLLISSNKSFSAAEGGNVKVITSIEKAGEIQNDIYAKTNSSVDVMGDQITDEMEKMLSDLSMRGININLLLIERVNMPKKMKEEVNLKVEELRRKGVNIRVYPKLMHHTRLTSIHDRHREDTKVFVDGELGFGEGAFMNGALVIDHESTQEKIINMFQKSWSESK